jgi:hypothetical protein
MAGYRMRVGRAIALWLAILAAAVMNGVLRQALLAPSLGRPAGFVLSGLLLMALIFLIALAGIRACCNGLTPGCCWRVGLLWFVLTLLFETVFAQLRGQSWHEVAAGYAFADGNIWPLVLAFTLVAPWLAGRVRRLPGRTQ